MDLIPRFRTVLFAFIFTPASYASASNECPANQEISCESLRSSRGYTYTVPPGVLCSENCEQGWYYQNETFIVDSSPNARGKRLPIVKDVTPHNLTISFCENLLWQLDCECSKCLISYTAAHVSQPRYNTSREEHNGNDEGKGLPGWGITLIVIAVVGGAFITILFIGRRANCFCSEDVR